MQNEDEQKSKTTNEQLLQYVERIERLEEEKKSASDDIRDVYTEAGSNGFDKKGVRQLVGLRKLSKSQLEEQDGILDMYRNAIGL